MADEETNDNLTPLAHCTLDEIVDELDRRTVGLVFAYLSEDHGDKSKAGDVWQGFWRGGKVLAVGLARTMAATLENELCAQMIGEDVLERDSDSESTDED